MRDQRDAGGPEARIVVGAGNLLAEFRRELAVHGRAMHADLLEHAAVHHRHHAAAARRAGMIGALPRRAHEAAGRAIGQRRARGQRVLERLERRADVVAQRSNQARARSLRASSVAASGRGLVIGRF